MPSPLQPRHRRKPGFAAARQLTRRGCLAGASLSPHLHVTSTRPALAVKNGVRPRCCDAGFPPYGPLSRRCRVPSVRAPGASSSLRAMPGARACRIRGSAHRLGSDAPLSGLDLACFLRMLARGIAGLIETARARRRFGAYGLRARVSPTPSCSSPDRGAEMIAGGRWRGRDKPPARVSHVHLAARAPRIILPDARAPRIISARVPHGHPAARVPHVHPASPRARPVASPRRASPRTSRRARVPTYIPPSPARVPHGHPGARTPRTSRARTPRTSRRACPTYIPARVSHVHPAPGARTPRTSLAARTRPHTSIGRHLQEEVNPQHDVGRGLRGVGPPRHAPSPWPSSPPGSPTRPRGSRHPPPLPPPPRAPQPAPTGRAECASLRLASPTPPTCI